MKNFLKKLIYFNVFILACQAYALENQKIENQKAIILVGYNNTRIYDVGKIRAYAAEYFGAKTVLCKQSPSAEDFLVADYVIDTSLDAKQELADQVINQCETLSVKIIAVLPFSDQGTQLGSVLAHTLKLPGANPELVGAGLDKGVFRSRESEASNLPPSYRPLFSTRINSKEELVSLFNTYPDGLFIKPCQEGNNRGCLSVESLQECDSAWSEVEKYKTGGILVEELVLGAQEYSCDAIGDYTWLTLKDTAIYPCGGRGEIQFILPAPESAEMTAKKLAAGRFMADLCGAFGGAYHNEIFVTKQNSIMAVEPNLRPAGMHIWDAAQLAFDNFNPWLFWMHSRIGQPITNFALKRNYYVGLRRIEAPKAGVITNLPDLTTKMHGTSEVIELVWSKKVGDIVVTDIHDNADYLGHIMVRNADNAAELDKALKELTSRLAQAVTIE